MNTTDKIDRTPTLAPPPRPRAEDARGDSARNRRRWVTGAATRKTMRNRQLRRLTVAWTTCYFGAYAYLVLALGATFSLGGVIAAGAAIALHVSAGRLLGSLAPRSAPGARLQLRLAIAIGARASAAVGTLIAVTAGAPVGAVLALVGIDALVSAAVRPLHGALVIRLADTPAEAAAATAASRSLLTGGALAGPALAGLALGLAGISWAFALPVLVFAAGMVAALRINVRPAEEFAEDRPAARLVLWPWLRRADALSPEEQGKLEAIGATPAFASLPTAALEQLARVATRCFVPAGADVMRQGDPGDQYYMIAAGTATVTIDGRKAATLGPGGSFGHIALLRNVSRSATVTAHRDLELVAVGRAGFQAVLSNLVVSPAGFA